MDSEIDDAIGTSIEVMSAAFGFVLASALLELDSLRTPAGVATFAEKISELADNERFSPGIGHAMVFIVDGIEARLRMKPDTPELL
jgi:hypothetical protein